MPPKAIDEVLLCPLHLDFKNLPEVVNLLTAEHERLVASGRAIAFYAIRSSMHGGGGSVAQSERTFRLFWLANALLGLIQRIPPAPPSMEPAITTHHELVTEYVMLEEKSKEAWKREGGILRFDQLTAPRMPS